MRMYLDDTSGHDLLGKTGAQVNLLKIQWVLNRVVLTVVTNTNFIIMSYSQMQSNLDLELILALSLSVPYYVQLMTLFWNPLIFISSVIS